MALTKVSYSMIQGAIFNVDDYGADPTGVADSTSAIQAAIDAAEAAGAGVIQLTADGVYRLNTAPLVISQQNIAIGTLGSTLTAN